MGIQEQIKASITHVNKFAARTQLGGLLSYRRANLEELESLRDVHKKCYPLMWNNQKEHSRKKKEMKDLRVQLLEIENKKPKATSDLISVCFNFDKISTDRELTSQCKALFDYINEKCDERLEHAIGSRYEQPNSAIILFCAELMVWIKRLSESDCNIDAYSEVEARCNYLENILTQNVFKDEESTYRIQSLILYVKNKLEKDILKTIEYDINTISLQKLFSNLRFSSDEFSHQIIDALCCIFSPLTSQQLNKFNSRTFFDLNAKSITRPKRNFLDIKLGRRLQILSNIQQLYPKEESTNEAQGEDFEKLLSEDQRYCNAKEDGIHLAVSNKEATKKLIEISNCLKNVTVFVNLFQKSSTLSHAGGNILLSGLLNENSNAFFKKFLQLICNTETIFSAITKYVKNLFFKYLENNEQPEWRNKYSIFNSKINNINAKTQNIKSSTNNIIEALKKIEGKEYKKNTVAKMTSVNNSVSKILKQEKLPTIEHHAPQRFLETSSKNAKVFWEKAPVTQSTNLSANDPLDINELRERAKQLGVLQ